MQTEDKTIWLSATEAANLLQCSRRMIWQFASQGLIRRRSTRFQKRYDRESVLAFGQREIDQRSVAAAK